MKKTIIAIATGILMSGSAIAQDGCCAGSTHDNGKMTPDALDSQSKSQDNPAPTTADPTSSAKKHMKRSMSHSSPSSTGSNTGATDNRSGMDTSNSGSMPH